MDHELVKTTLRERFYYKNVMKYLQNDHCTHINLETILQSRQYMI